MGIKYLRSVSRFPLVDTSYLDEYSHSAFRAISTPETNEYLTKVTMAWHRPSGDRALLEEGIKKYDVTAPKRLLDGDYLAILKKTMDELRPAERLVPLTLGAAAKHPDFPRTASPGFPWTHQGYHTKSDVLNDKVAMGKIHRTWDSIGRGTPWSLPDCLAFQRVVASEKHKTKVRPVWGFPTEVVLEEARYFLPLIEHLKGHCNKHDAWYGLGLETALSGHAHLARSFTHLGDGLSLSCDISNFDARVPHWIIRDVFAMISDWFDFSKVKDSEGKYWNVNVDQTARRWKAIISYFINTKIRTPSGMRIQKSGGVPSGSMWTNFIDSAINAVQTRTAIRRVTGIMPNKDYYFGDDGNMFLRVKSLDLTELASVLLELFNAILSVEKTILTDNIENIHWLGFYYRPDGPRRSLDFIIASTLYPERPVDSPLESCARLLGQLYSTMDPKTSVFFYDAILWIQRQFDISTSAVHEYLTTKNPKSFKYLINLGLSPSDLLLPECFIDPIDHGRWIPAVLPRPSPRSFVTMRSQNLPQYAFVPEAYQNRVLRAQGFHDFFKYLSTFEFYDEAELDQSYFSD